jgi:hypothetical protein
LSSNTLDAHPNDLTSDSSTRHTHTLHDVIDIPFSMIDAVCDPSSRRQIHAAKTTTAAEATVVKSH